MCVQEIEFRSFILKPMRIIDFAFQRSRVVILAFCVILFTGTISYLIIAKEAAPDIPIPIFYVSMAHEGISPEDAERLLVRPMEKELQSLEGLKEIRSVASEGHASVTLEFRPGLDADEALLDIREKVDLARSKLPLNSDEPPRVYEINIALFPVLSIALAGPVPERLLVNLAQNLQEKLESLSGVLEAKITGDREEMMEVVVDPGLMESYNVTFQDIVGLLQNNNQLVAAGALDTGAGRMVFKVPGVIEDMEDIMSLPVKIVGDTVVTFEDVVFIRHAFKDPASFARVAGESAVIIEISKRLGTNIIDTIKEVRELTLSEKERWPSSVAVTFMQDESRNIQDMLKDLQNNVVFAIILVMIVVVAVLGVRPALLVGLAIPGAFLAGILSLHIMGNTLNIVVLFSLILVVGMLVDGAIVTVELADRKIAEGFDRKHAYAMAARRMSWPITAATATTLAVFVPLLFWPGLVGEFMKFLPLTVLCTLVASLFMALIFIPTLGGLIGSKRYEGDPRTLESIRLAHDGDLQAITGFTSKYLRVLEKLLRHPIKVLLATLTMMILTFISFGMFGKGVEFFPDVEPDFLRIQLQTRGDLSIYEKDALVKEVEQKLLDIKVFKAIYSRTVSGGDSGSETIGIILMEFVHWRQRPPASEVIKVVRERLRNIPGVKVQVRKSESGPSGGKPVQIQVRSNDTEKLSQAVDQMRTLMKQSGGFVDVEDNRPLPGIEWRIEIDREQAARYGADVVTLGSAVQMLTNGLKLAEYRPDHVDEELDIRLRFESQERHIGQLEQLRIPTSVGHIPINNFIRLEAVQNTGHIYRVDGRRAFTIEADVSEGLLVDQRVQILKQAVAQTNFDPAVWVEFKGEDEDQQEAMLFLMQAFGMAILLMLAILLLQFNNFYQAGLILSAIVLSTTGVILGLLVTNNPYGIVMCGIGIIALAGIVVNNNIILIDTYNEMRERNLSVTESILRSAAQRLRPVLLTAVTTILGLIPMVFSLTINFFEQDIAVGAPSTQWWVQLASSIAGGLAFATILTLILTPCLLILGKQKKKETPVPRAAVSGGEQPSPIHSRTNISTID